MCLPLLGFIFRILRILCMTLTCKTVTCVVSNSSTLCSVCSIFGILLFQIKFEFHGFEFSLSATNGYRPPSMHSNLAFQITRLDAHRDELFLVLIQECIRHSMREFRKYAFNNLIRRIYTSEIHKRYDELVAFVE